MTTTLKVLTTPTSQSPFSGSLLLVNSSGSRTLIGSCAEGMQRAILEYRQKLRNIDRVCLVGLSTFSAGREDATHTPGRQNINCIDENKSNKKENAAAGPKKKRRQFVVTTGGK
mmetsp:Transcript_16772/g.33393  ORF Transcript_16772/g.33393 Transcript_16772/m.33393 type:complete len:114 (+) Transcript_16772:120-461(+)